MKDFKDFDELNKDVNEHRKNIVLEMYNKIIADNPKRTRSSIYAEIGLAINRSHEIVRRILVREGVIQ